MILNQYTMTLGVSVLLTLFYWCCGLRCGTQLKADNLLSFALKSGGIVTGIYITVAAFKQGNSTNAVYTGICGVIVFIICAQNIIGLFRAMFRKIDKQKASKADKGAPGAGV